MDRCKHGFNGKCAKCYAEAKKMERIELKSGEKVIAVMPWNANNVYLLENAVKLFTTRKAAEKHADTLNESPGANYITCAIRSPKSRGMI